MTTETIKQFMKQKEELNDQQYLMATLAYHLAPVVKCKKASSILTFNKRNRNVYKLWDEYKEQFSLGEVTYYELKRTSQHVSVLFFIPNCLKDVFNSKENREFLKNCGYDKCTCIYEYLERLKNRYKDQCPHEIGLFLGVPLKDVESFIKHDGSNYLVCGYWKVYHKLQQSIALFKAYDKAKDNIVKLFTNGRYKDILAS
ncbi:DUF3793 family protein [Clostridiaceae bacterium M8S5]|nr:DUF3793 family protein [Clostridiaceae bacterium M8S5]